MKISQTFETRPRSRLVRIVCEEAATCRLPKRRRQLVHVLGEDGETFETRTYGGFIFLQPMPQKLDEETIFTELERRSSDVGPPLLVSIRTSDGMAYAAFPPPANDLGPITPSDFPEIFDAYLTESENILAAVPITFLL